MYLVDTSVWVDYLKNKQNAAVEYFEHLLSYKIPYGLTGVIYQEVLQGAKTEREFIQLKNYLELQRFYFLSDQVLSYEQVAKLYFNCRKKGITIRSNVDWLIAQIAIENDLIILHNDKDFVQIQKARPELKLFSSSQRFPKSH